MHAIFSSKRHSLEQNALDLFDKTKARTRGVTAISAAALWLKAGEYTCAQQLASSMITDSKIPAFACEELRKIVQANPDCENQSLNPDASALHGQPAKL
jgi:hypothetical protein